MKLVASLLLIVLAMMHTAPIKCDVTIHQRLGARLPLDVRLLDDDEGQLNLARLIAEGPLILMFGFYSCPRLCPVAFDDLATALSQVPSTLRQATSVLVVSIDPRDTPKSAHAARLALAARHSQLSHAKWHFTSGETQEVRRLSDATGFYYESTNDKVPAFRHASGLTIISPNSKISSYLLGIGYSTEDLTTALNAAAMGKQGPTASGLMLLCAHLLANFEGRYSASILLGMRIFGLSVAAAVAVIVGFAAFHRRREAP